MDVIDKQIDSKDAETVQNGDDSRSLQIKFLFFARARDLSGMSEMPLVVSSGSTAGDCLNKVISHFPGLKEIRGCMVLTLNEEYTLESAIVKEMNWPLYLLLVEASAESSLLMWGRQILLYYYIIILLIYVSFV